MFGWWLVIRSLQYWHFVSREARLWHGTLKRGITLGGDFHQLVQMCVSPDLGTWDWWQWGKGIWSVGACPLFLGSMRYQWIARLAGECWPSESCRCWDSVICSLSDWPFRDVLRITLVKGFTQKIRCVPRALLEGHTVFPHERAHLFSMTLILYWCSSISNISFTWGIWEQGQILFLIWEQNKSFLLH